MPVQFHMYIRGNTKILTFFYLMTSRIMSETGHTVQVTNLSSRVSESDLHEFFSFSGPIEHIELIRWCFFYSLSLSLLFFRESKFYLYHSLFIVDN